MDLANHFIVEAPLARAWSVLTDVERVVRCLPGAELQSSSGDEYLGTMKMKVGPVAMQFKGTATFVERDVEIHRLVLHAEGRETRGQGSTVATITVTMTEDGTQTAVEILTDLSVTGKVAQFGRGVLADVSSKMLSQFAAALAADLRTDNAAG